MNSLRTNIARALIAPCCFLLVWSAVAPRFGLPSASEIGRAGLEMIENDTYVHDILISAARALLGFVQGFALGVFVGILTGRVAGFYVAFGGLLQFLRWTPVLAIVPLTIRVGGLGEGPKVFLIAWGCFFVTWVYTHTSVSKLNPAYVWWCDSLGLTPAQRFFKIYAPSVSPSLVGAARVALAIALIVDVAAELSGTLEQGFFRGGLGYRISRAIETNRNDVNIACILTFGALGVSLDFFLIQFVKRGLRRLTGIDFYGHDDA